LAFLAMALCCSDTFWAEPKGGEVVSGEGTISLEGLNTRIDQASNRLAIDWQSFNVAANESVRFVQPSSASVALNRIFDQNPSQIFGAIDANGRVFLMNPNGMVFGVNSRINVAGLLASS
jgi:filamentous hemagglutinin family protein